MPGTHKRDKIERWGIPSALVLALVLFIALTYGFWFETNDDCVKASILAGTYLGRPDLHDVYSSPVLGFIVSGLYRLAGAVPWYGLLLIGGQMGALWACLYRICAVFRTSLSRGFGCTCFGALFLALLFYELVFCQYTIAAAVLADAAIFWIMLEQPEETGERVRWKSLIVPFLLYVLSELFRTDVALMHLVFLGIACVYKVLWDGRRKTDRLEAALMLFATAALAAGSVLHELLLVVCCFVLIGCYGLVWLFHCYRTQKIQILKWSMFLALTVLAVFGDRTLTGLVYGTGSWSEYTVFNEYRTELYDYLGIPDYGGNAEIYEALDLSWEEHYLLLNNDFALSDKLNADTMEALAEAAQPDRTWLMNDIKRTILSVVNKFWEDPTLPYDNILIALFAVAVLMCLLGKNWIAALQLQFVVFGHVLCWSYLGWIERAPERVTHGLYLVESLLLFGVCLARASELRLKWERQVILAALAAGTLCLGVSIADGAENFENSCDVKMAQNMKWTAVREYCFENPDKLYFLDVLSFASYCENIFDSNRTEVQNYELAGGWTANTPLYYEKLENFGIEGTVFEELQRGGTIYLICDAAQDTVWIQRYLSDYDITVDIRLLDTISTGGEEAYAVYSVCRTLQ